MSPREDNTEARPLSLLTTMASSSARARIYAGIAHRDSGFERIPVSYPLCPTPEEINLRPGALHHRLASNLGPDDNSYMHRQYLFPSFPRVSMPSRLCARSRACIRIIYYVCTYISRGNRRRRCTMIRWPWHDLSNGRKRDESIEIRPGSTKKRDVTVTGRNEPMERKITANFYADLDFESRPIDQRQTTISFWLLKASVRCESAIVIIF